MKQKNKLSYDTSTVQGFLKPSPDHAPHEVFSSTKKKSISSPEMNQTLHAEKVDNNRRPLVGGVPERLTQDESDINVIYDWMRTTQNSLYDAVSLNFFKKGQTEHVESLDIYGADDAVKTNKKLNALLSTIEGYRTFRNVDAYFLNGDSVVGATNTIYSYQSDVATFMVKGTKELVEEVIDLLKSSELTTRAPAVKRVVLENGRFQDKNLSLSPFEGTPCNFYPYFDQTPEEVWDSFAASKSNVLLLIGEPGTGKSNFIRQMMEHRGYENVPYLIDNELLLLDPMLISYLQGQKDMQLMIAEDADNFVAKREDHNKSMVGLLNMSSGIAAGNTKIILSTNLANMNKVDPALVRPGRCFKILTFEKLSVEQASNICCMMGLEKNHDLPSTLAEVLNGSNGLLANKKSFGFNQ